MWPALLATAVAAGAATLVLRPRSGLIEPAAIELTAYFSPAELERAADFRDLQRVLGAGRAGPLRRGALRAAGARARRRSASGRRSRRRASRVVLVVVGLPLGRLAPRARRGRGPLHPVARARGSGTWRSRPAIGAVFAALGGALVHLAHPALPAPLVDPVGRAWWWRFAVLTLYLSPVVIDPLFNKFEPLPKGELRSDVLALADRAGVDVGQVYRVDASRRTTAVNAYVGGLGHTKRVVLYDNLIEDFPPDQVRSVVAHELGHVENRDLPRGLLWIAIVAPAGTFLVQRLTERIARSGRARRGRRGPTAGAHPGRGAGAGAGQLRAHLRGQRALAPGRGARRRLRARAHHATRRRSSSSSAGSPIRNLGDPDPPGLLQRAVRHPPDHARERLGLRRGVRAA